jgi:hypothetical protein
MSHYGTHQYCCRLDQEFIMGVVRNRSGQDSGKIDMNLRIHLLDRLCLGDLLAARKTLEVLKARVEEKIKKKDKKGEVHD